MSFFIKELEEWFQNQFLPLLLKIFDKRAILQNSLSFPKGCYFISSLFFIKVKFSDGETKSLVVKIPDQVSGFCGWQDTDLVFNNERIFYEDFARLGFDEDYPYYYYGTKDPTVGCMLILENLSEIGYQPSLEINNVPLDYTLAALRKLGKFHANGYAIKEKDPEKFYDIVKNKIVNVRYKDPAANETLRIDVQAAVMHFLPFVRKKIGDDIIFDKLEKLMSRNSYEDILVRCSRPKEPLATICHGDYVRNNIIFKKIDNPDGSVIFDAKVCDFGMIFYSTPIIDISTFLYLCCSKSDLVDHLDLMLKTYHESLLQRLIKKKVDNMEKYSHAAFLAEFKERALFGFVIAVFFRSHMENFEKCPDLLKKDFQEWAKFNEETKNEKVFEDLVDIMVFHMKPKGLLELLDC